MCNIKQYGETMEVPFSHKGIIVDSGTVWYMDGRKIIIDQPVLHYHNTNGDVNTKYLSFQFQDDKSWNICTHKMFAGSAKTEEPLVERFITPDQIMRKSPCMEGASTLYKYLGIPYSEDPYLNGANLAASGKRSLAMNMQSLADGHLAMGRGRMPDNWLLFLANALNLVPNMRKGPDRATILRLLGIKE